MAILCFSGGPFLEGMQVVGLRYGAHTRSLWWAQESPGGILHLEFYGPSY